MTLQPTLVAHRGHAAAYPENTLSALESACAAGAAWVEIDVQRTRDGKLVLFHDGDLQRLCAVPGTVHDKTWQELQALSCANEGRFGSRFAQQRMASLEDFTAFLAAHEGVEAFVEIKHEAFIGCSQQTVLAELVEQLHAVRERCVLISFAHDFLALARAESSYRIGAVAEFWDSFDSEEILAVAPDYFICDVRGLPQMERVQHEVFESASIAVWEVQDASLLPQLAARGVDFVETFEIEAMLRAQRGER